ncbi:uncharacterized protein RSE6_10243 [Rhynchosporium secalis]|uniref:Uncharacterized protein n=1 Tax=Rhynchosporium secalis TaxID=38038 RepID=A0A1E1MJW4_RHYSE|nr:uncharacterized protein RSE6_10243 [Rhynchosporium secalis]
MRLFTISTFGLGVGVVLAGADIQIDFPGFLRAPRQEQNLQTFTGALGGVKAEAITGTSDPKRPFAVGSNTFTKYSDAAVRTCNNQKNACAKVSNGNKNSGLSVGQCDDQESDCTKIAQTVNPSTLADAGNAGNAASPSSTAAQVEATTQQTPPQATTTQQQAAPATTQQAAPPSPPPQSSAQQAPPVAIPVLQSSASPVEVSTPTALPVIAPQPTLHSSDEKFFYFCDP